MARDMMSWEELLSFEQFDEYDDEYGPHTQAVVNCFKTLDTISWFSQVGASSPERPEDRVDTWTDAIEPIMGNKDRYGKDGHLLAPSKIIDQARDLSDRKGWYKAAFKEVLQYADYDTYVPSYFEKREVNFTTAYLASYFQKLLVEIISADTHDCSYFREQLTWYEAGHFCCGWTGEWPDGVLRVF